MRYSAVTKSSRKIGQWSHNKSLKEGSGLSILNSSLITENETEVVTLMVVTKVELPYVMLRPDKTGNEAFEGFAIDLLKVGNRNIL